MLHLFFLAMLFTFLAALIALPVATAPVVPWWGTLLIILGELVFLRYTFFKILGFMFAMFVQVGLRLGTQHMRGASVDVHSVTVVPKPGPDAIVERQSVDEDEDEAPAPDAPGTRYVNVDCTVTPAAKTQRGNWPIKHYDAGSFVLSAEGFVWPKFPPTDDEARTGRPVAAAVVKGDSVEPVAPDKQLVGARRLSLTFKCPPTLGGRVRLKFLIITLARLDLPQTASPGLAAPLAP